MVFARDWFSSRLSVCSSPHLAKPFSVSRNRYPKNLHKMAKFLIALSIAIIIFIYFNYPFQSENISFLIVFSCFVVITFAGAKIWTERNYKDESYEDAEKELNKRHNENGKFKYVNDGFYFTVKGKEEFIKWNDILEVNSFSIPAGKWTKQTGIELITNTKNYEFNDNNTSGMDKFGDKLFENLPNWRLDTEFMRVNNYGVEKRNLYQKNGSG